MSLTLLRKDRRLTTTEVAKHLGITQGHYSHIENGTRSLNPALVHRLAEILDVSSFRIEEELLRVKEQRDDLTHWIAKLKYRDEPLEDEIIRELRYIPLKNKEDADELIYRISDIVASCLKEQIKIDFQEDEKLRDYFLKRI